MTAGDRVRLRPEAQVWIRNGAVRTGVVVAYFPHPDDGSPMVQVRRDGQCTAEAWSENCWIPLDNGKVEK